MDRELWQLGGGGLLAELDAAEGELRAAYARSVAVIAAIDSRGVAGEVGATSTRQLLQWRLHLSGRDATTRIAATGMPTALAAVAAGAIGLDQVRTITDAVRGVPVAEREPAEQVLIEHARELDHASLVKVAKHLKNVTNPDGPPPLDDEQPHRELRMTGDGNGGTIGTFRLDPEGAAVLKAALDPLSAPRPETSEGKDRRPLPARRGDALVELARRALESDSLPGKPQVGVLIDHDKLTAQTGTVGLDTGDQITIEAMRRIACDAAVYPVVLRGPSEPLDIGRTTRTVPAALRRALIARDRGCTFPGCQRPATWCHAHHIQHWTTGGPTTLANLVLLCGHHHRVLHHTDWTIAISNGRAHFTPPAWADPTRRPLINHTHHLDDRLHRPQV